MHAETWKDLPFNSIFHHPGEPDIAVITLNQQIAPSRCGATCLWRVARKDTPGPTGITG